MTRPTRPPCPPPPTPTLVPCTLTRLVLAHTGPQHRHVLGLTVLHSPSIGIHHDALHRSAHAASYVDPLISTSRDAHRLDAQNKGLTLVYLSAERRHFLGDALGTFSASVTKADTLGGFSVSVTMTAQVELRSGRV